jgi:large subunit ribosomal protein L24
MRKTPKPFEGKLRIKTGDTVQVIAGKDKGRTGKVTRVLPKAGKCLSKILTSS